MKRGRRFLYDPNAMLNETSTPPIIDLAELDAAMHQAPGSRAPLIVWMMDNHDDLVALFARRRVNWTRFCGYIAEHGFLNGKGQPLKPEAVRQCWKRARAVVAHQRSPLTRTGTATGTAQRTDAGGSKARGFATNPPPASAVEYDADSDARTNHPAKVAAKFKPVSLKPQKPVQPLTPEEEAERNALRQRMFGPSK
jgi:hypothetical protein